MRWLAELPELTTEIERRWGLSVDRGEPFDSSAAWIARAQRRDGSPAVLKLIMPHFEAQHEIEGLLFWNGDPTVRVFASDSSVGALLIEECRPGVPLALSAPEEQDRVIAGLLRRAWGPVPEAAPFRPLASMVDYWADEVTRAAFAWPDSAAVRRGLEIMADLASSPAEAVVLVTDLHAGNVLRGERAPWIVVDPKPFVGDRTYDATQHLLNSRDRLAADPEGTIGYFCQMLEVDASRVQRWLYARLTADPRESWEVEPFELAETFRV